MKHSKEDYGKYIKSGRVNSKKTLAEVAKALGIFPSYLSDIENNKRNKLPYGKIPHLAKLLNLEIGMLCALVIVNRTKNYNIKDSEFKQLCEIFDKDIGGAICQKK